MQIRHYEPADLEQLAALDQACFHDPWSLKNWEGTMDTESYACFVLEEDGKKLAGFILFSLIGYEGELLKVGVLPEKRGTGCGGLLLDTALECWKAHGVESVFLEVRRSNEPARALYRKKGFYEIGLRKNYYDRPKEHALLFQFDIV